MILFLVHQAVELLGIINQRPGPFLFSDTETGKYLSQQVVGGIFSGDFAQMLLGLA
jgi:hypothetical protein